MLAKFFCVCCVHGPHPLCLWTEVKSRAINTWKKNEASIQPSNGCTSLVNEGFIRWKKKAIFLQDLAGNPSGQDTTILAVFVANHFAGFSSSCLLTELTIKKNRFMKLGKRVGGRGKFNSTNVSKYLQGNVWTFLLRYILREWVQEDSSIMRN